MFRREGVLGYYIPRDVMSQGAQGPEHKLELRPRAYHCHKCIALIEGVHNMMLQPAD